jgi:integrase
LRVRDLEVHHVDSWFAECHRFHKRPVCLRDEAGNKIKDKRVQRGKRFVWTYRQTTKTEPVSDTTKFNLYRGVRAVFALAYKKGFVDFEALRGLDFPTPNKGKKVIPDADWQTILTAADDDFRDTLEFLWETGARPKELRCAEARHLNRERRCLIFAPHEAKCGRKTKREREIHLNDRAFHIVATLAIKRPAGPLFLNSDGRAWEGNALTHRCTYHSAACGVKFTSYQIRHTWATRAHAAGVDQKSAADMMGHCSTRMVDQVYTHPSDETLRAQLRKLEGGAA